MTFSWESERLHGNLSGQKLALHPDIPWIADEAPGTCLGEQTEFLLSYGLLALIEKHARPVLHKACL